MPSHIFTGFGFGPIQSALFAKEAFQSGNFERIVVAEVDAALVAALKANRGNYCINVARPDGIETVEIEGVELLNPSDPVDRAALLEALKSSTEIVTSLPSVDFFETGGDNSVASLIAQALAESCAPATIVYTAENNNHAAEILQAAVEKRLGRAAGPRIRFLNTVIGKMSQVVTDPARIERLGIRPMVPGLDRAFLVEQFNKILVTKAAIADFTPGIEVFVEKEDLLPFEEAKLYGHNAIHALLAYLGAARGYEMMTELADDAAIMKIARDAFLAESGAALIARHADLNDELFTESGYRAYAEDLLRRMTNPYLADTIARAGRDIRRKLAGDGRIFGTMTLALENGIQPENMALGAYAALTNLALNADNYSVPTELRPPDPRNISDPQIEKLLTWLWTDRAPKHKNQLIKQTTSAREPFLGLK